MVLTDKDRTENLVNEVNFYSNGTYEKFYQEVTSNYFILMTTVVKKVDYLKL